MSHPAIAAVPPAAGVPSIDSYLTPPAVRVITARKLLEDFKPIESVVHGLPIPRGGVTTITAKTGHGKTTLLSLLEVMFTTGHRFAGREVSRGSVLVLAGENPDDYTMHLAATLQHYGLSADDVSQWPAHLLIVPGVFDIDAEFDRLRRDCTGADLVAVVVDTSAAFYMAPEENDNVQMRLHASKLRDLTRLPGNPAVIVLCHPTKGAGPDNLLPRGGGSFLAEIDANLTLWKDDADVITLHWQGKIRGPAPDPIKFELVTVELEGYTDSRGHPIRTTAARHLPDERADALAAKELAEGDRLLVAMLRHPDDSQREWQMACGFTYQAKVQRLLASFAKDGLVEKGRVGTFNLTTKGKREADDVVRRM